MVESHPNQLELAWAAGFFDGEGCFTISKDYPHINIGQTDIEVLDRFRNAVGIGKVYGPYAAPFDKKNWRPQWYYGVTGKNQIEKIYELIGPYLSSIKKEQYQRVMEKSKPVARPGYCRKNLHLLESDKMSDGRCGPCRRESNRAAWNRNGRVAP